MANKSVGTAALGCPAERSSASFRQQEVSDDMMKAILRLIFPLGCVASVLAPIVAIVLYPKANWLFAMPVAGILLIIVGIFTRKGPSPTEIADRAQRLLDGNSSGWDVDDYEHANPKDPHLKELWLKTMEVGSLPETWVNREQEEKNILRKIIAEIRQMRIDTPE